MCVCGGGRSNECGRGCCHAWFNLWTGLNALCKKKKTQGICFSKWKQCALWNEESALPAPCTWQSTPFILRNIFFSNSHDTLIDPRTTFGWILLSANLFGRISKYRLFRGMWPKTTKSLLYLYWNEWSVHKTLFWNAQMKFLASLYVGLNTHTQLLYVLHLHESPTLLDLPWCPIHPYTPTQHRYVYQSFVSGELVSLCCGNVFSMTFCAYILLQVGHLDSKFHEGTLLVLVSGVSRGKWGTQTHCFPETKNPWLAFSCLVPLYLATVCQGTWDFERVCVWKHNFWRTSFIPSIPPSRSAPRGKCSAREHEFKTIRSMASRRDTHWSACILSREKVTTNFASFNSVFQAR